MENHTLLAVCFILCIIFQASYGLDFQFPSGVMTSPASCASLPAGEGSWSMAGHVTFTGDDRDNFVPRIFIQAFNESTTQHHSSPVCSVDLDACPPANVSGDGDQCYCSSRTGDGYDIVVRRTPLAKQSGLMIEALVHSSDINNPFMITSAIGQLPNITSEQQSSYECNSSSNISNKPTTQNPTTKKPTTQESTTQNPTTERPTEATITNCAQTATSNPRQYAVLPNGLTVMCDTTDGGNWIVFQRRTSGKVDFNRNWVNYTHGFGDNDTFWLGLNNLHSLCNQSSHCEMRVDMARGVLSKYAKYGTFYINGPSDNHRIHLTTYTGTAGDSMLHAPKSTHSADGMMFSTYDQEHDTHNCAAIHEGAWWFDYCMGAHLNGKWGSTERYHAPFWVTFTDDYTALTFTEMKVRQLPRS